MKAFLPLALLLLTPPGTPSGGFRWQRIITPPTGAALAQACVVLDADTFANAAPALRDLRLFQDGAELPYVVEESFDEMSLLSGITRADDRSLYETVAAADMPSNFTVAIVIGISGPKPGKGRATIASVRLAPHVPVERILFDPAPQQGADVEAEAVPVTTPPSRAREEVGGGVVSAAQPSFPFTVGANLQSAATVTFSVPERDLPRLSSGTGGLHNRVLLQMRRRSLCYQPRTASPLVLYLGGGAGMAAKTYSFANSFSPGAERPLATMGPLSPNPDEQASRPKRANRTLWMSLGAAVFMLLFARVSFALVHRSERRRYRTASSTSR